MFNTTRVLVSFMVLVLLVGPALPGPADPGDLSVEERWQQLMDDGAEAQRQHDTNAALAAYEMAVRVAESFEASDPRTAETLAYLGFAFVRARRPLDALAPFTRFVELRRLASDYRSQTTANSLLQVARAFLEVGEIGEAIALIREAIEIKETLPDSKPTFMISELREAAAWRATQDVEDAEKLLLHALEICERTLGPSDPCMGRVLNRLGQLYLNHHPPSEKGLEYLRRSFDHTDPPSAYKRYLVMSELLRLQRYEEAVELHRVNLEIQRARDGERHRWVAGSLQRLATTLRLMGDLEGSEKALRESLDIAEEIWGADHRVTRDMRNQLIAIIEERGGTHELGPATSLELDPPMPRPSEEDVELANEIERRVAADDLEGAIEAAERWIHAADAAHGEESLAVALPWIRLAELLARRSLFEEALAAEERTLQIVRLHVSEDDPRHLSALRRIADLLRRSRARDRRSTDPTWQGDEALKYYELELSIRIAKGESSPEVAELLDHMGWLVSQTDPGLGEGYFARAAEVWGDTLGRDSAERFGSLKQLVRCLIRQHKYDEAEALVLELLERCDGERMPDGHPTTWLLNELKTVYCSTGRPNEATALGARIAEASE